VSQLVIGRNIQAIARFRRLLINEIATGLGCTSDSDAVARTATAIIDRMGKQGYNLEVPDNSEIPTEVNRADS